MNTAEIVRLAHQIAASYCRKVWWAEADDLQQEAVVAIYKALKTFDPDRGVPKDRYAHQVARRAVSRYLVKQSSPVTASKSKHLIGHTRVSLVEASWLPEEGQALEVAVASQELAVRVAARMKVLNPDARVIAVMQSAKRNGEAKKLAAALNVPTHEVHASVRALKRKLRKDPQLERLMEENT
jgi:RNA polymerase sigma factor (sigma-70 family)